jgi:hypothetical protein
MAARVILKNIDRAIAGSDIDDNISMSLRSTQCRFKTDPRVWAATRPVVPGNNAEEQRHGQICSVGVWHMHPPLGRPEREPEALA